MDIVAVETPDGSADLMSRLAERVRDRRADLAMPRRELAERSRVSPRYLAQLEAGEGNISVMLLQRVAGALGLRIEDMVAERDTLSEDARDIASLFQAAPQHVQSQISRLLMDSAPHGQRAERVCLLGLQGAGKTTLGRKAAEALNIPFVSARKTIEAEAGRSLDALSKELSPQALRQLHQDTLEAVVRAHTTVVMVPCTEASEDPVLFDLIRRHFHTIWIQASPADHVARMVANGPVGGAQDGGAKISHFKTLLETRAPLLSQADAVVDTTNRPVQSSVNDVLAAIAKNRFVARRGG